MKPLFILVTALSATIVFAWAVGIDMLFASGLCIGSFGAYVCNEIYAWFNTRSTYAYPSPANWRAWDDKTFWECYYLHHSEFGMGNALGLYAKESHRRALVKQDKQASDFWKAIAEEFV